jgi:hypothetical protein
MVLCKVARTKAKGFDDYKKAMDLKANASTVYSKI